MDQPWVQFSYTGSVQTSGPRCSDIPLGTSLPSWPTKKWKLEQSWKLKVQRCFWTVCRDRRLASFKMGEKIGKIYKKASNSNVRSQNWLFIYLFVWGPKMDPEALHQLHWVEVSATASSHITMGIATCRFRGEWNGKGSNKETAEKGYESWVCLYHKLCKYIPWHIYWGRDVSRAAAREVVPQTLCLWE